jgi:hypothetical protein
MNSELVTVILLGLGCAVNPWGIMIVVLLLNAKRGHGIVWTFAGTWAVAIAVGLAMLVAGLAELVESGSDSSATRAAIIDLVLGVGLLAWGVQRIVEARRRRKISVADLPETQAAPDATSLPRWLQAIENISYIPTFLLAIYSATWPFVIAAAGEIVNAGGSAEETAALSALFVLLGSSSVVGIAVLGTSTKRADVVLGRLRAWITAHNRVVIDAILVIAGLSLIGKGVTGLF